MAYSQDDFLGYATPPAKRSLLDTIIQLSNTTNIVRVPVPDLPSSPVPTSG